VYENGPTFASSRKEITTWLNTFDEGRFCALSKFIFRVKEIERITIDGFLQRFKSCDYDKESSRLLAFEIYNLIHSILDPSSSVL